MPFPCSVHFILIKLKLVSLALCIQHEVWKCSSKAGQVLLSIRLILKTEPMGTCQPSEHGESLFFLSECSAVSLISVCYTSAMYSYENYSLSVEFQIAYSHRALHSMGGQTQQMVRRLQAGSRLQM